MRTLVLSLLICPLAALAQAPVIEISGANFRPMPIAVPAPQALNDAARTVSPEFDDAFFFDCSAAGIFQVLDRKSYLADAREGFTASTITFSRWADVGAEALVKVQLSVDGRDVRGEMRLFTVSSGKEDLRLVHVEPVDRPRRMAHFFADALYKHFTREPGPFQSHLAFVRKVGANKDVYLGDWDGKRALPVAQGNINLLPVVGPQGDSVAYTSYRSGHPALYLQRPGGTPVTLVSTGAMVTGASFSPDGRRLAYSMAQGEGAQIFVADANGANPQAADRHPLLHQLEPHLEPGRQADRLRQHPRRDAAALRAHRGQPRGRAADHLPGQLQPDARLVPARRPDRLHRPRRAQRLRPLHGQRRDREGEPAHPGPGQQPGALVLAQRAPGRLQPATGPAARCSG